MTPQLPSPQGQQPIQPLPETQFISTYESQLQNLVNVNCKQAIDREKVFQYAIVRRNDFYYRGNQNLVPTFAGNGSGQIIDFRPVNNQTQLFSGSAANKSPIYDYVINNFRGDMRKFVGVLGQKSPNVKAMPSWPSDDIGNKRAGIANDTAGYLRSQWDVDGANRYLVLSLGKNGTTFLYTPFVTNAERYGEREEPIWGTKPEKVEPDSLACPQCGFHNPLEALPTGCEQCFGPLSEANFVEGRTEDIPTITGYKKYPNGTVELHVHSVYDVTTPFYIKSIEQCPWLWLEHDEDAGACVQKYPERGLEDMLKTQNTVGTTGDTSTTQLGQMARNQASSPNGYEFIERPNRWRKSQFWLTPSMYNYLVRNSDEGKQCLAQLKAQYPRGIKLTWINNKLVQIEHERLDEVWAAVKPETSEYIYADPIFNDYIQGADVMNDATNIIIQLMETNIPALIYDPNVLNAGKIRNGFQTNEFVPCVPGMGSQMGNAFYKIPTSSADPALFDLIARVHETLRNNIGLVPAIWGGDDNTQTAEQARRRLNQALMVLATTWNEMRKGWARAYRNGIRQLARYSLGRLVNSQGDAESVTTREVQDLGEVLKGGWENECDQAIPMTWTQLRDFVMEVFSSGNEQMISAFGMQDPANMDKVSQGIGIPGWNYPGLEERNRIRDLIGQLLEGEPITTPMGTIMPSVPLDFKITWNPKMTADVIHEWLMSEDGRSKQGTPGFDNVVAAGWSAIDYMGQAPPVEGEAGGVPAPANPGPPIGTPGAEAMPPDGLPGTQPPDAPDAPLMPLNGPGGNMPLDLQPMVQ